jgi:hypothetical protein
MLAAISAASEDALKLLVLVAVGGGLLALGRWGSRLGVASSVDYRPDAPTRDPAELSSGAGSSLKLWPPSAEEVAASLPFDPALGKLSIRKFYFKKADAIPGPADPEVFADESNIEPYDPESGHAWWQSYFVATPQGLTKRQHEKSWRYLHAPDIPVFPRYNLEEIRRALVSRIIADHEYFNGTEQAEEESL